ncbi:MAG: diaminopimelate decarboxylase [Candidatus Kapabacteria bacterium]|nr:diaminopimelate decarboxylase [Candidatus Kapabacteria bacterium]
MVLENDSYTIQRISVLSLVEKYSTPLYVYNADKIKSQYDSLVSAFGGCSLKVKFACKALTNINIMKLLRSWGCGVDTVSLEEVELALLAGFTPQEICYTPNCVGFDEIQTVIEKGILVNIDDLSILEKFGHTYGNTKPCCIRFNPHILAGGNPHIQVGHIDSKFGISVYQLRHLLRIVENYNINVVGVHMHTGSDILDPSTFLRGAEILFDTARSFKDLQFIDFGSGFKVPYKDEDYYTNIQEFGAAMSAAFKEFCKEYGRELEIWFEPGKFLVSESGYFLVKTNVIKQTVSTLFAGVNSGQNHLIRPMFYDAYHKIINISNPTGTPRVYSVVGYICETDTFGWDRKINEIREDDILCFYNAGAYGYSMSSNYNSRVRPAEVLMYNGKDYLIRRRETIEDILNTQQSVSFE